MTDSHYKDFAALQKTDGLRIIAFPCNQFGAQEPGTGPQIKQFAQRYGLKVNEPDSAFFLMAKTNVNGPGQHPVYSFLKQHGGKADVGWNFLTKFLVRCSEAKGTCDVSRYDNKMPSEILHAAKMEEL